MSTPGRAPPVMQRGSCEGSVMASPIHLRNFVFKDVRADAYRRGQMGTRRQASVVWRKQDLMGSGLRDDGFVTGRAMNSTDDPVRRHLARPNQTGLFKR